MTYNLVDLYDTVNEIKDANNCSSEQEGLDTTQNMGDYSMDYYLEHWENLQECLQGDLERTGELYTQRAAPGQVFCNTTHDTVSCWPTTPAGQYAIVSCPREYNGLLLHPDGVATKYCYPNGTWMEWANYTVCTSTLHHQAMGNDTVHHSVVRNIYLVGFSISTLALIVAFIIFLYFRALRCLRNLIHCHLIMTFILKNLTWILLTIILPQLSHGNSEKDKWLCRMSVALFNYLQVTNFYWMLVEGIYLLTMVVWAFSRDKVKKWHLFLIGWGIPAVIIIIYVAVKMTLDNNGCWVTSESNYDYIYIAPILLVLLINVVILSVIVYILVTKLRATHSAHSRQSRKAVKATLILFPLLGITYVIFVTPFTNTQLEKYIFMYINAVLQSLQGLAVAVFYCFLNGEVKSVIQSKFSQWRDERSIATRYTRASVVSAMDPDTVHKIHSNNNSGSGNKGHHSSAIDNETGIPLTAVNSQDPFDTEEKL